jgi:fatty acid desaturase
MTKAQKIKTMNIILLLGLIIGFACIFIGMRTMIIPLLVVGAVLLLVTLVLHCTSDYITGANKRGEDA